MASNKELSVAHVTKRFEALKAQVPEYTANLEIYDLVRRLPVGVPMDLVTQVLRQQKKRSRGIDGTSVTWVRHEYAPAAAAILREHPADPISAFLLAALPADATTWGEAFSKLVNDRMRVDGMWMDRDRKARPKTFAHFARDPAFVAGAQAAVAVASAETTSGLLLFLAHEGSEGSIDVITPKVEELLEDAASNLDFLNDDLAPLLHTKAAAPLKQLLGAKTQTRNAGSRGLQAGEALGLTGAAAFKFKLALFAAGDWPKIRLWFDSSKDPWYGGIWNWNEVVHFPKVGKKTPLEELEGVLEGVMKEEATWVRGQVTSPHRGPFKKTLIAWVPARLKGVTLG